MFRNLLNLLYVTLPAAALMAFAAFMYKPTAEVDLFADLVAGKLGDDYSRRLLETLTVLRFGKFWWVFAIAVIVLVFAEALMVAKIDRHMKTWHMPALPMKRAFGAFPYILLYVFCCVAASELGALVMAGLSFLIKFIGNTAAIVSLVFGFGLLVRMVISYLFGLLLLTFPLKYSENYRFNRAMSYSARLMFAKKRVVWTVAVSYPLLRAAVLALAWLLAPYDLDALVYAVAFFFVFSYVPCLAYKYYYDDVGGERRDVGQIMFG